MPHNKNEFGDKNTKKRNEIFNLSPPNYQTDDHFRPVANRKLSNEHHFQNSELGFQHFINSDASSRW